MERRKPKEQLQKKGVAVNLRPYQSDAVDAAIKHIKKSLMPGLIELSGGAGKSHIMAAIAKWIHEKHGKSVLCLQPTKELCKGNAGKYIKAGGNASIYSASAGSKCLRYPIVFATPGTVARSLSRFGDKFGAVLVDEAHRTTNQVMMIIDSIREKNPNLRVLGMTGSPYKYKEGFIYQYDVDGSFVPEDQSINPYYNRLLYRVTTRELIDRAYLTPMHADPSETDSYSTKYMRINSSGNFYAKDIEQVFEGKGRLTYEIVKDVVNHSAGHSGVMIFAATVQHAKEIMESMPPENSRMLGGDVNMGKSDREKLIDDFENKRFKYLVSVGTLTTGVDFPHVSIIAVLRAIESPGLFQQILWRGVRLINNDVSGSHELIAESEKPECVLLDYAENIERHNLHDDLFTPEIKTSKAREGGGAINAECPECGFDNEFSARPNPEDFKVSKDGYFLDLAGNPVETDSGPMPAHFGRRCTGQVKSLIQPGIYERCEYRWTFKECPECQAPNDIAARFCEACKGEIIDPNEKLQREFQRIKKDPYETSTDKILNWTARKSVSKNGNDVLVCTYTTEYRTFNVWYMPESKSRQAQHAWHSINDAVYSGHIAPDVDTFIRYLDRGKSPTTITARRQRGSQFFNVIAHNKPEDIIK